MKNIHVLPTEKASRLFEILKYNLIFDKQDIYSEEYKKLHSYKNQNIYITSDEEIKEGDWYITPNNTVLKALGKMLINVEDYKKIILTTNQELIQDGVQAIDDEFLEWFVKNPSCEYVKVIDKMRIFNTDELRERHRKGLPHLYSEKIAYKIIIPKEEPKQICEHSWIRSADSFDLTVHCEKCGIDN